MRVEEFDFPLPRHLIATHPVAPRDAARLLAVESDFADRHVRDLPILLRRGDVMVINDTRVIPTRLYGRCDRAAIEVTLHRREGPAHWRAFIRNARRVKLGDRIEFATDFAAIVAARHPEGDLSLDFNRSGGDLRAALERYGAMPLPPYIKRPRGGDPHDRDDYQTIFATNEGAVAAPTAGLHFTSSLLETLDRAGIVRVAVTLHVGAGTFLPVKADDTSGHKMHGEWGTVDATAAARLNAAHNAGRRIVAIGTTAARLLESAAEASGAVRPFEGETELFITPGYRFRAIDVLLTNFHLPRSTLFMLVSAFAGLERMKRAYAHAVACGYRFFSYGDACLLFPETR